MSRLRGILGVIDWEDKDFNDGLFEALLLESCFLDAEFFLAELKLNFRCEFDLDLDEKRCFRSFSWLGFSSFRGIGTTAARYG